MNIIDPFIVAALMHTVYSVVSKDALLFFLLSFFFFFFFLFDFPTKVCTCFSSLGTIAVELNM